MDSSTPDRKPKGKKERQRIKREPSSPERKKRKRKHDYERASAYYAPKKKDKKKKKKKETKRRKKHKDTTLAEPIADNKYIVHLPVSNNYLIRCICGSTSWDSIMLTCIYCGVVNHGSCYSILHGIDNVFHVCGYCSVVKNISCTDDSVKNIYSIHDMTQEDWKHVENEFLYKKAAISYMKKEHLGYLGMDLPRENFLQTRFDIASDLASHVLGHLRVKHLISFTPGGVSVDRDKINTEFGLFQRAVPDPVTFDNLDNYKSTAFCQTHVD